ncbi:MAG TPA: hypothetical protein DCR46_07615, partial [Cytophagales bacterium]|nr:hypothetical protein [Cytophagales bacterium]
MKLLVNKLRIVLSFFFCTLSISVFAQKEAYNWVLGSNVKLDFNTFPPTFSPLKFGNAKTPNIAYNVESSTAVSDAAGQLLFYTTGQYLYNGWTDAIVDSTLATSLDASQGNVV